MMKRHWNRLQMPRKISVLSVLLFSCSFFLVNAAESKFSAEMEKEAVARDAKLDALIGPEMSKAIELRNDGQYKQAIQKCDEILDKINKMNLGSGPYVVAQKSMIYQLKEEIREKWGALMLADARKLLQEGDRLSKKDIEQSNQKIQEAISLARECKREAPATTPSADPIITMGEKILRSNRYVQSTSLSTIDPDNLSRKQQIAINLREAEVFYKNRQFEKARDVLEQILVLDPYNDKAVFELKKIYLKLSSIALMRRENEILERMNENEWKWNNSILPKGDQAVEERGPQESTQEGKAKIYEKLQSIIIPEVDFGGVNVNSILIQLKRRSKELDPEKIGVNIVFSSFETNPEVSLQFSNIPLGEVIRYLCQYAKLKYKVEENSVLVGPAKDIDDMDTRVFKMRAALYNRLTQSNTKKKDKEKSTKSGDRMEIFGDSKDNNPFSKDGGSKDSGGSGLQVGGGVDSETLKKYFEVRGIPFEQGSSISFDSRSSKLFVKNTPDNLRKLDSLLREIDIVTPLVLVESKIVEIMVADLEELGFDWTLTKSNSNPRWISGIYNSNQSAFSNTPLMQALTRHYSNESGGWIADVSDATGALVNNMNIMPNFGPDGAYNVFLTVRAIDQSQRGEILSAPKIIATSGLEATVKFAREMYFPESWDEPEVTANGNNIEYTPSIPQFGDARDIGIIFTVLPQVSPNNHTITLLLKPQISNLTGWTVYDYQIRVGEIRSYNANSKMPEISLREMETNVKVYDGETVVLGGILNNEISQVDDKYPFLGDIPLLGRFFSSNGTDSEKTNLMIFVTTRIMNLDGVPVKSKPDNGLFDFNR